MEKVWEELKKIEAQAEQIRTDAQNAAKSMVSTARQDAETLIANSKMYAEEKAQQAYSGEIDESNRKRDEQLKANMLEAEKLKAQAEKHVDSAITTIVKAVVKGS